MERLVTTAQAAEILGISLQGVHYRIKKNQLKSIKKSGKTYVYINEPQNPSLTTPTMEEPKVEMITFKETIKEVVKAKDEQILLLKKSIKWMRKQHGAEILRLENNQKRIIGVFNREIELLQSAFNEMRSIYKPQLINQQENKEKTQGKTKESFKKKEKFISIIDFTLYLKRHNKSEREIKLIIMKAIEGKDSRFIFNKKDKKLLILNEDFSDLI